MGCWTCVNEIFAFLGLSSQSPFPSQLSSSANPTPPPEEDEPLVDRPLVRANIERPLRKSRSTPSLLKSYPPTLCDENSHNGNPYVGYFLVHGSKGVRRRLPPRPILKRRQLSVRRSLQTGTASTRRIRFSERVTILSPLPGLPSWDRHSYF